MNYQVGEPLRKKVLVAQSSLPVVSLGCEQNA